MYSHRKSELDDFIHEQLKPVVDEVIQECPRFRILVIGKVELDITPVPRSNVWADRSFAPGEVENFNTVKNFILQRANMPNLPDRLHAIWFCLEIPATNNALLERGDLNFLDLPLRKVPVVVAFTKLDILVRKFEDELYNGGRYTNDEEFGALVWSHVEPEIRKTCLVPLREATRHFPAPLSSVAVSTQMPSGPSGDSLKELMEVTQRHVDSSVYMIWALAQRVNVDMKIEASILIGKRKYWRGLASSFFFAGKTLMSCLNLIHRDIIAVWNFCDDDKRQYLQSDEFKAMIVDFVSDLIEPTKHREHSGTLEGIAAAVTDVLVPDALPVVKIGVTVGVKFAQWVYDVYSTAPHVIRCLMGYIVDLIIVMQSLFWMMKKRGEEKRKKEKWGKEEREGGHGYGLSIGRELIKEAAAMYRKSGDLAQVHESITKFVTNTTAFRIGHKDDVLEEIERLIQKNRFLPPVLQSVVELFLIDSNWEAANSQRSTFNAERWAANLEPTQSSAKHNNAMDYYRPPPKHNTFRTVHTKAAAFQPVTSF
ncbi:hypothetical protein BD779DRAFT_1474212 [Infundibulicybe gibba]|nr:hypothetical protein BD779DRAFT_1474212 [Infundibulicybe gibba]